MFGVASRSLHDTLRSRTRAVAAISLFIQRAYVTKRVYIGNLPVSYGDNKVRELIPPRFEVQTVHTPQFGGVNKGYSFVDVEDTKADELISTLKGTVVEDKVLLADYANPVRRNQGNNYGGGRAYGSGGGNWGNGGGNWGSGGGNWDNPRRNEPRPPPPTAEGYTSVYVGNLPWNATVSRIQDAFNQFRDKTGAIRLPSDPLGRPKGFAFVEIKNEALDDVILGVEGTIIDGRAIRVGMAKSSQQSNTTSNTVIPPMLDLKE